MKASRLVNASDSPQSRQTVRVDRIHSRSADRDEARLGLCASIRA